MRNPGWLPCLAIALALAACGSQEQQPATAAGAAVEEGGPRAEPSPPQPDISVPPARTLEDVMERDPRYLVGISFPDGADQYPGLARALDAYARAARDDLDEAVASLGEARPRAPYDLALDFSMLVETPSVVAVRAEGSSYTGGAHGNPLVARFVWLPQRGKMLEAADLIEDEEGWRALSEYVREQLHAQLFERVDAWDLEPGEREQLVRSGGKMIEEGSAPDPANFAHFEPQLGPGGRITALRFVFPPYQVGPYSDGTNYVTVPGEVLLPHLAPEYRDLFAAG
ncbi:hypothetical protein BGP89_13110 [Luteimonas sp. JM171]|uniref:DUF3298 and DUF4163 domain-containing protein n=1 Tax=Luteimonas sp. JM171 TaxID=1896164 RepID=UPI0008584206|nr:DUF3298 and DUF4163 domain-containing protein [Luteimonas sp. JM171]AOH37170.1 hypothetical protein BGP89_13110 [Luteimonas sp. JM171]